MRKTSKQEALIDRASLDGRIAAVMAAFLLAYGFIALLDRVGAPERLVSVIPPYFTIIALASIGFLLHSMRISLYYAAGRAVPACYAGFANAAIIIGLSLPFVARLVRDPPPPGASAGFLIGVAGLAWLAGPVLRKSGAFSVSDLLGARFSRLAPRLGIIAATAASSALVALAGYQTAVGALTGFTQTGRSFGAFVIGAAILMIAGPGGLSGVIWSASAAAGVTIVGFGWPILSLWRAGVAPPLPFLGDKQGFEDVLTHIDAWRNAAPPSGVALETATVIAVALGLFTLAPALAPAIATYEKRAARRAGFANFGWTLVMAMMIAATVGLSALSISRISAGRSPDRLPDAIYAASARGLVKICGASVDGPAMARQACAGTDPASGPLRVEDVAASGEYLLGALPQLAGLGAAAGGLLASALIALGLALASSGLQACATALGHEGVYRLRGETALTSRRLAITRVALTAVTALGFATSAAGALDAATLVGAALAISAACLAPLAALAFWPRVRDRDAVVAQLAGLAGLLTIASVAKNPLSLETLVWAALAGFVVAVAGGVLSALDAKQETPESRVFIEQILHGEGEVSMPDKGV